MYTSKYTQVVQIHWQFQWSYSGADHGTGSGNHYYAYKLHIVLAATTIKIWFQPSSLYRNYLLYTEVYTKTLNIKDIKMRQYCFALYNVFDLNVLKKLYFD